MPLSLCTDVWIGKVYIYVVYEQAYVFKQLIQSILTLYIYNGLEKYFKFNEVLLDLLELVRRTFDRVLSLNMVMCVLLFLEMKLFVHS